MTIYQFLDEVSVEEFYIYIAYFSLTPIDSEGFYSSQQMWQSAQMKSTKKLNPQDFKFDWFDEMKDQKSHITAEYVLSQMGIGTQIKINRK